MYLSARVSETPAASRNVLNEWRASCNVTRSSAGLPVLIVTLPRVVGSLGDVP